MDILAAELKMDPAEIRLKNFIRNDEFPYPTATGLTYDSGDYAAPLKKALDRSTTQSCATSSSRPAPQGRLVGIGMSTYGEICAFGPRPPPPPAAGKAPPSRSSLAERSPS